MRPSYRRVDSRAVLDPVLLTRPGEENPFVPSGLDGAFQQADEFAERREAKKILNTLTIHYGDRIAATN